MLAAAYERATEIPRIYSMLVIRHGRLVAEEYFDEPTRTTPMPVASVGKSILGALVGIAVDEGYVSLDQRSIDFFPEYDVPGLDRRKRDITIRHLVQMRAGYPADNFLGDFTNNSWNTEGAIFCMIARDVLPAANRTAGKCKFWNRY